MRRTATELGELGTFASAHHGAFDRVRAAELGFERMALRRLIDRGMLTEPAPGVFVIAGSPNTWRQRSYVSVLAGRSGALSIRSASARLHRVDGFERSEELWVAVNRGGRILLPDVHVSQTLATYPREDRWEIDGIPCAGLARTICDIAPLGTDVLERAMDDFQRRGHSLLWLQRTAARLRTNGRPGIAAVDAELARRRVDPALRGSWFEKLVEECLRSRRLPGLVRQHVIRDGAGRFLCSVDLAVPSVRFAIEAHSRKHHTGPGAELIDERRESLATAEGWLFEYLGWYHVTQTPQAVCRHFEKVVARRALDLGVELGLGS